MEKSQDGLRTEPAGSHPFYFDLCISCPARGPTMVSSEIVDLARLKSREGPKENLADILSALGPRKTLLLIRLSHWLKCRGRAV